VSLPEAVIHVANWEMCVSIYKSLSHNDRNAGNGSAKIQTTRNRVNE